MQNILIIKLTFFPIFYPSSIEFYANYSLFFKTKIVVAWGKDSNLNIFFNPLVNCVAQVSTLTNKKYLKIHLKFGVKKAFVLGNKAYNVKCKIFFYERISIDY